MIDPIDAEEKELKRQRRKARDHEKGAAEAEFRITSEWVPPLLVTLDRHNIPVITPTGPDVPLCIVFQDRFPYCAYHAGRGTLHPGTGPCWKHGGRRHKENVGGAFVTAHAIAQILDVDPWEAMEVSLRRAYAWSAWYQAKLATVTNDNDLRPGGDAWDWVKGARETTELTAKYAKMAHDMGISERHVRVVELQGTLIANVLSATLHELGLDAAQEDRARAILDYQLRLVAETGRAQVVQGEITA
jgi:hypothetical protein